MVRKQFLVYSYVYTLLICLLTTLGAGEFQKALESAMAAQGILMQIYGPLHEHLATCYKWVGCGCYGNMKICFNERHS